MKNSLRILLSKLLLLALILFAAAVFPVRAKTFSALNVNKNAVANSISGIVFDNRRNALADVEVELLDDLWRYISRARTDATGRYSFSGMGAGRFKIRAMPLLLDYEESLIDVEIVPFRSSANTVSSDSILQDIYLQPRKGGLNDKEITGTIFVQNIPKGAENFYKQGVEQLKAKRLQEGIKNIQEALNIFPTYYSALDRIGNEFFKLGQYEIAAQAFIKAAEVNNKSAIAYYMAGYSFYMMKNYKATNIALRQALFIAPSSPRALLMYGNSLRVLKEYAEAEKQLLQAKKFAKGTLPDINFQLALLYGNDMKKYKEAAQELELYIKARPDSENSKQIKDLIKQFKEKAAKG